MGFRNIFLLTPTLFFDFVARPCMLLPHVLDWNCCCPVLTFTQFLFANFGTRIGHQQPFATGTFFGTPLVSLLMQIRVTILTSLSKCRIVRACS